MNFLEIVGVIAIAVVILTGIAFGVLYAYSRAMSDA